MPAADILKYVLNQVADLDRVFQALADPGRRLMVERLSLGPASVSELGKPLAMSLAAVVQHVQVLEALLGFLNWKDGRCFPSLERLAERAGCAISTAQLAIAAL